VVARSPATARPAVVISASFCAVTSPLDRTHKPRRRLRPNVERLMRYRILTEMAITEMAITVMLVIALVLCAIIRLPVLHPRIVIVISEVGHWRFLTPRPPLNRTRLGQSLPMAGVTPTDGSGLPRRCRHLGVHRQRRQRLKCVCDRLYATRTPRPQNPAG